MSEATPTALVVGGTGPTGPAVVAGLRERGYTVTLLHSGRHELDELLDLEHLHGDAFSRESLTELLAGRCFDLVVGMYGRTRVLADVVAGRCEQFIAIGGVPVYAGYFVTDDTAGMPAQPIREDAPLVSPEPAGAPYPVHTIRRTEDAVFDHHARGSFSATVIRYPTLYGPRVAHNWEWLVIRRIRDGRKQIFLPDDGLSLHSRLAWANAGHAVLAVVDHADVAAGQAYNVADRDQYALREWVRRIAQTMDAELEIHSVPGRIPSPGWSMFAFGAPALSPHFLLDTTKIRTELGYVDAVSPMDALSTTIDWSLAHAASVDRTMGVFFDDDREDTFALFYEDAVSTLRSVAYPFADVALPPR